MTVIKTAMEKVEAFCKRQSLKKAAAELKTKELEETNSKLMKENKRLQKILDSFIEYY